MGDESWIYSYDHQTKMHSSQWKTWHVSPCPKKGRMERSCVKLMLIFFFDIEGVIWSEFLPQDATANSEYYEGELNKIARSHLEKNT